MPLTVSVSANSDTAARHAVVITISFFFISLLLSNTICIRSAAYYTIFRGMSATGGKFDSRTQSHESPLQLPRSAEQI